MNFPRSTTLRTPLTSFRSCMSSSSTIQNHYDTLQVEHDATQQEIKAAYYKLTKQYHPDVNKTEEAKGTFRNISEAYEILGNYKARKQYDRGIIARGTTRSTYKEDKDHPHMAFYKSRMDKYPKPVRTADSKVYDFDAWTRAHYGHTFKKTLYRRETAKNHEINRDNASVHSKKEFKDMRVAVGFIVIVAFAIILSEARENFDVVSEENTRKGEKES